MKKIIILIAFAALVLLSQEGLCYTFVEQEPVQDSVRLVLNQQESQGDIVALDVVAYDVPSIDSAVFDLDFDSSVIKWEGIRLNDPDGFLKGDFFDSSAWYTIRNDMDVNGTVNANKLVVGVIGDIDNPVSGNGNFITIVFRITGTGSSTISFSNNNLIMPDDTFTSTSWLGGTIQINETPEYQQPQNDPPLVTLMDPPDGTVFTEKDLELTCSADDDYGLKNLSLYTDISGSWSLHGSVDAGDTYWVETFYLTGLGDGTYRWNCLAHDDILQGGWASEDSYFTVSLPSDSEPPVISNDQVSGDLVSGTDINISFSTDEPATCRYATSQNIGYEKMKEDFTTEPSTFHSILVDLSTNCSYKYFVRCKDASGNANEEDYEISFSLGNASQDTEPPVLLGLSPATNLEYGRRYTTIRIATEETAECRISNSSGKPFGSMESFAVTGAYNHSHTITGLAEGRNHTYYIRCKDYQGNENADTQVSFFVCYEVDSDCSRAVEMAELLSYIDRWYMNNKDVRMVKVMQGVGLWKAGSA